MKRLLLIFIFIGLIFGKSFAATGEGESGGTSIAVGAAASAAAMAAIIAQEQAQAQQASLLAQNSSYIPIVASGVLICHASYSDAGSDYNYNGCKDVDGYLSVQDYFNKYKPSSASQIVEVIFDSYNYNFQIYYR